MKRLALRLAVWPEVAVFLVLAGTAAMAADRSVTLQKDTDLPGFDYQVDKGSTLENCQKACIGDDLCRAFTFNTKTKWCFMKGGLGELAAFKGATSGTIVTSPSAADIEKARTGKLLLPHTR